MAVRGANDQDGPVHLRCPRDHVLDVVGVPRAVHLCGRAMDVEMGAEKGENAGEGKPGESATRCKMHWRHREGTEAGGRGQKWKGSGTRTKERGPIYHRINRCGVGEG